MNVLKGFRKILFRGVNTLSGKASSILHSSRNPVSPFADRILADALRIAEIPSPTTNEEQRAAFVLERLSSFGIVPWVDENGNVLVRIHGQSVINESPLLLFTDLGSNRWHPLESLSRLDSVYAKGAGLADVLGTAVLLYVAEAVTSERLKTNRDILLLFAARSFDDPESDSFISITESRENRPFAAIGVQGFLLGSVITHVQGTCRIEITVASEVKEHDTEESGEPSKGSSGSPNEIVDTLISIARKLSGISWDPDGTTRFYIHRIEANTAFGRTPTEGILEVELESSDGSLLDMAMKAVTATALDAGKGSPVKTEVNIISYVPVGEPSVNEALSRKIANIMKESHIKIKEENGSDPSSFLSIHGIPALSLGVVHGREGMTKDTIEIASIDKGRQLIEAVVEQITKEEL